MARDGEFIGVLTGGPVSGKSTALESVRQGYLSPRTHILGETATLLIQHHNLGPKELLDDGMVMKFQPLVAKKQIASEDFALEHMRFLGKDVLLCDRGILDGAGYCPGKHAQFEDLTGLEVQRVAGRYQTVFWFTLPPREIFEQLVSRNPTRVEDWDLAVRRSQESLEAWSIHNDLVIIDGKDWREKESRFFSELESRIG